MLAHFPPEQTSKASEGIALGNCVKMSPTIWEGVGRAIVYAAQIDSGLAPELSL